MRWSLTSPPACPRARAPLPRTTSWPNTLGIYPTLEGSITDIQDFDVPPGYAMTGTSDAAASRMIYFGGPTRGWKNTPAAVQGRTILTFEGTKGAEGLPAAVIDGNKLLMSVHAEAYEGESITGLSTAQRIKNYKWRAAAINQAAGTDFAIPA